MEIQFDHLPVLKVRADLLCGLSWSRGSSWQLDGAWWPQKSKLWFSLVGPKQFNICSINGEEDQDVERLCLIPDVQSFQLYHAATFINQWEFFCVFGDQCRKHRECFVKSR